MNIEFKKKKINKTGIRQWTKIDKNGLHPNLKNA